MILERMEKGEWKIREKMDRKGVWLGGEGRGGEGQEKNCEAQCILSGLTKAQFAQNSISPKWEENHIENEVQNIGLKCPHAR